MAESQISVNSRGQHLTSKGSSLRIPRRRRLHNSYGGSGVYTTVAPGFARLYWHPKTTGPTHLCCQAGFIWTAITHEKTGNNLTRFSSTQIVNDNVSLAVC